MHNLYVNDLAHEIQALHKGVNVSVKVVLQCASRTLCFSKSRANGGLPFDALVKLVESVVCPVIEYSAPVWGSIQLSKVTWCHHPKGAPVELSDAPVVPFPEYG